MPVLMLMRHGKSCWDEPWDCDHDRPLAKRGVRAAGQVGRIVSEAGLEPQLVITSSAVRALTTARLASEAGSWSCPIETMDELYGGGVETVLTVVRGLSSSVERTMLVGHNPTWSETVSTLIGGGAVRFPTAATACFVVNGTWDRFAAERVELQWLIVPRLLV